MGAFVTGIEPQHTNIKAALAHAQADPVISDRTTYLAVTAEEMASTGWATQATLTSCDSHHCTAQPLMHCTTTKALHSHQSTAQSPMHCTASIALHSHQCISQLPRHCTATKALHSHQCTAQPSKALHSHQKHCIVTTVQHATNSRALASLLCCVVLYHGSFNEADRCASG